MSVLAAQESNPLSILVLVVPFGLLIWLMVMPQRKQKARQKELMSSLSVGDEVMTTGGIVGQITFLEDDLAHVEIDHDVVIRVARGSIARSMSEPDPAAAAPAKGGMLAGLFGGGAAASKERSDSASSSDTVDVRATKATKSSGTGVGAGRSANGKSTAKAGSRKK